MSTSPSTSKDSGPMPMEPVGGGSVKQKRSAERQLTKDDDPDDDDANTDTGGEGDFTTPFRKADDQVLKSRRILKARRPMASSVAPSLDTNTNTTTITAASSSIPSNPFAATTLIVEPLSVPGTNTSTTAPVDPKKAEVTAPGTSEQPEPPVTVNEEQTKDNVDKVQVTHSAPETSTTGTAEGTATTSASTASTPGPFKVFGSFAGFGGGFPTSGFGAAASTIKATATDSTTGTTASTSTSTGFAFASTSTSTSAFGTAPTTTTSATSGSIFGSVSSNSFSFGFANQTNGESQTVSPKVTLPESVELTTGEEEELNLHDCRCKTFKWVPAVETEESTPAETKATLSVKPSKDFQIQKTDAGKDDATSNDNTSNQQATGDQEGDEKQQQDSKESTNFRWQELGVGPMKLLQDNSDPPKYRLVQRRESSPNGPATKVLLNLPLYKESKVSLKAGQENYLSFITIGHDGRNETYLWKFKEVSQAQMFARFLEGILPHARSCFVG